MMPYTPEQIEQAIKRLDNFIGDSHSTEGRGNKDFRYDDIRVILAALEAAQKERDKLLQQRNEMSDSMWKEFARAENLTAYAAKLEKAGMFLRCALEGALSAMQLPLSECEEIAAWDAARKEKP